MSIWDDLDKKASEDNRVGIHDFIVDKKTTGEWPSGDPFVELEGRLVTHENLNLRSRFNPDPSEERATTVMASGDRRAIKSVNFAHQQAVMMKENYGKTVETAQPGDTFRVKIVHEDKEKKYVKIDSFVPKSTALTSNGSGEPVPF